ncbi:MAG TPA: protein kinase [Vicinamibacterales bacterium]
MIGQSIAHYRIVKKIGAGGMGQVFLAQDTRLDRPVAIKILLTTTPNAEQIARFEREAKAAAALNHPNIVSIHELGVADQLPYVVMERLDGLTLRQRLLDGAPPLDVALGYARDIIQGVMAAHERGICHRDLKPDNVFVTSDGRIKILDFGLAHMRGLEQLLSADTDAAETAFVTSPGVMIGSTPYMSPEQVRGELADQRSDLFTVGLLMFELLTGTRCFREPTAVETMHAILKQPAPLDRIPPSVPPAIVDIVERCLAKEPMDRFASARELATALRDGSQESAAHLSDSAARRVLSREAFRPPSVAVLPFVNTSADADMEYFSDGITEELINAIAQIKGLQVAARTSSFAFKGRNASIPEVGSALNVTTVLEGSVRRSGQKLRVTAQLINVASGYQLWSERYERQLDDVFAIQDDIASKIAGKLEFALSPSSIAALARPATASIEAYDLYLKGRYHVEQRGDGVAKGLEFFKRAIAIDPAYAPAYAGTAEALSILAVYALVPPAKAFEEARAAATRAVQLNDRLAEAHNVLALVAICREWDWPKAAAAFDKALAINPNCVPAHYWKGLWYHCLVRREADQAIHETKRAVDLDPIAMVPAYALGVVLMNAGRYDDAIALCEPRIAQNPMQFLHYQILGAAYLCVGRPDAAIPALEKGVQLSNRHPWFVGELGTTYAIVGRTGDAQRIYDELATRSQTAHISPMSLASIALHLGRIDEVVALYERAFAERDPMLITTTGWPAFAAARTDPRVQHVYERMGVQWAA